MTVPFMSDLPLIQIRIRFIAWQLNNAVVEMTLPEDNTQIFASKYETILPSKEALQKLMEEQMSDEKG